MLFCCQKLHFVFLNELSKINLQGNLQGTARICPANKKKRGVIKMAKNTVPEAKEALNRFKMEAASEVGVSSL